MALPMKGLELRKLSILRLLFSRTMLLSFVPRCSVKSGLFFHGQSSGEAAAFKYTSSRSNFSGSLSEFSRCCTYIAKALRRIMEPLGFTSGTLALIQSSRILDIRSMEKETGIPFVLLLTIIGLFCLL